MKFKNVAALLYSTPWLIVPERLELLDSVFQDRRQDISLTDAELQLVLASNRPVHQSRLAGLRSSDDSESQKRYTVQNGIGVLYASGVLTDKANMMTDVSGMTSYQQLATDFTELLKRDDVSRIVMDGDSPGGVSTGCTDLARLVYSLRGTKQLDFFVSGQCCSGMYYIASAFNQIIASPSSVVGSIGAYMINRDTSKAQENAGVKIEVIRSVDLKARGLGEPLTEAARSSFQNYVTDVHDRFVRDVAKFRGVSVQEVNERYGNGASLDVERAFSARMVDRIQTWQEYWDETVVSPRVTQQRGQQSPRRGSMRMSERIKAFLLVQGLIANMSADDASAESTLRTFCKGLGVQITAELEGDETNLLSTVEAALASRQQVTRVTAAPAVVPQLAAAPVMTNQPLSADEQTIAQRAATAANLRCIDVRNRAAELSAMFPSAAITEAEIDAAMSSGVDVNTVVGQWMRSRAQANRPANPVANNNSPRHGDVRVGSEGFERFIADASPAIRLRLGDQTAQLSQSARDQDMQNWRLSDFVRRDLEARGQQVSNRLSHGQLMREWFTAQTAGTGEILVAASGSTATGGAGRMPTLLGNVMGLVFQDPIANQDITFTEWCFNIGELSNFNPRTIATVMNAGQLDENMTGADPKKADWAEEATWIKAGLYNKSLEFTFVEQENDDFNALATIATNGRFMCDDKMESLAVNLLTSTLTTNGPDGATAVSTARGNLIDTGSSGDPSVTQFDLMQKALRVQVDAKGNPAGSGLGVILHTYDYETLMGQLLPQQVILANGVFTPTTQTNVNPFASGPKAVKPIYVPRLDKTSKKYYYGLSRKGRALGYGYKTGYGPGGQRRIIFNPKTGSVEFIYEQAGAVVLMVSQYIVANKAGQA